MHNTILLPPIYHDAGVVLCIRDKCGTSVSLCIAASKISVRVFVTGAISFCVVVQCIVLPPIYHVAELVMCIRGRCNTIFCLSTVCIAGFVYSWQVQYRSVSLYIVYIYHDAGLVMCIRDRCNTILCLTTVCIAGFVYSGQVQYNYASLYGVYWCLQYITMQDWLCVFGTGVIPFCVFVHCIYISRCRTGYVYSGQVQYHSVSYYSVYSGFVYSGQAQYHSVS